MIVETEEVRQQILDLAGEELVFDAGTIKGYPGFSTARLYDGETSLYHVERTEYMFYVTTSDAVVLELTKGNRFTYSDGIYSFIFELSADPAPDLTGFSKLRVDFKGKDLV